MRGRPRPACRLRRDALGPWPAPLDRCLQHRGLSVRGGLLRRPPIDCCVFPLFRRTSRCPRRSPGTRRRRRTPGRARRRGRRGWLLCHCCCPSWKIRKSRSGPFLRISHSPALRLSIAVATGGGRPWCGGLPPPPGTRGGGIRPCRVIFILAVWPVALVLFAGCVGFGKGAANVSVFDESCEPPRPQIWMASCRFVVLTVF